MHQNYKVYLYIAIFYSNSLISDSNLSLMRDYTTISFLVLQLIMWINLVCNDTIVTTSWNQLAMADIYAWVVITIHHTLQVL